MIDKINELKNYFQKSSYVVFFGGAGVSTESGIPDFRSTGGLFNARYKYPPEVILSYSFFKAQTSEFYRFYRDRMVYLDAKPNTAHTALAQMEKQGKLKAVITQNIDGLHHAAGSKNVIELHGCMLRNFCMSCNKFYSLEFILQTEDIPLCSCGGIIKPDVVLYEEGLDETAIMKAVNHIADADMLIIGGTSLSVYPAAGMVNYYMGDKLVIINKSKTHVDRRADVTIHGSIGEVLTAVLAEGDVAYE